MTTNASTGDYIPGTQNLLGDPLGCQTHGPTHDPSLAYDEQGMEIPVTQLITQHEVVLSSR